MFKGLVLAGLGTAAAIYFLDEKKGKKRRAQFRKKMDEFFEVAGEKVTEYSRELGGRAEELSKEINKRAQDYSAELSKNGHKKWAPSGRFVGAVGSALAFYAAGRQGLTGAVLRTLSLGMFTRALIASR